MKTFKQYFTENLDFDYLVGTNRRVPDNKTVWVPYKVIKGKQTYKLQYGIVDAEDKKGWVTLELNHMYPKTYDEITNDFSYNLQPMSKQEFEEWFTIENI